MHTTATYRSLLEQNPAQYPIFHQPWWLDIVCGYDKWHGIVSRQHFQGKAAIMPLPILPRYRIIPCIRRPLMTPYLGPWWPGIEHLSSKDQFTLSSQLWPDLIEQFPQYWYWHQTFRPEIIHTLPFHQSGFKLLGRYAYRLSTGALQFNRSTRRQVKKANELTITSSADSFSFYQLLSASFSRQQRKPPLSQALLVSLFKAANERQQANIWQAQTDKGEVVAALMVLWDSTTIYLLSNGVSEKGRQTGAFPALVAQMIQHPPVPNLPIDLCGTMLPSVAKMNIGFGASTHFIPEIASKSVLANWILS